jgi:hypothetical protein
MIWIQQAACIGVVRNGYDILVEKPEGRDHLGNTSVDGRIILKLRLKTRRA